MKEVTNKLNSEMKAGEYQIYYQLSAFNFYGHVEVKLTDERSTTFACQRRIGLMGETIGDVRVNWWAMGDETIEVARNFAEAMLIATDVAKTMQAPAYLWEVSIRYDDKDGKRHHNTFKCIANTENQIHTYLALESRRNEAIYKYPSNTVIESITRGKKLKVVKD